MHHAIPLSFNSHFNVVFIFIHQRYLPYNRTMMTGLLDPPSTCVRMVGHWWWCGTVVPNVASENQLTETSDSAIFPIIPLDFGNGTFDDIFN